MIIIHLTRPADWEFARHQPHPFSDLPGEFGYLHCCLPAQVERVAGTWFAGEDEILALEIDTERLRARVVFENLEGGEEEFPHIYGPLNRDAVVKWYPIKTNSEEDRYGSQD